MRPLRSVSAASRLECSWPDLGDWDYIVVILTSTPARLIRMQLTRLRGLRPCSLRALLNMSNLIRMQLTRLRGLRLFGSKCEWDICGIRMQLTRLRGLRLCSYTQLVHSIQTLECSWPDLGDWDNRSLPIIVGSIICIRMQLTRLRGLRLSNLGIRSAMMID